jgi:preprotein translocase subunit SecA
MLWLNHLEEMSYLRESVRLRAYGQRDPLLEYKSEGHKLFQKLLEQIDLSVGKTMMILRVEEKPRKEFQELRSRESMPQNNVGRNDPCPCGSGKKYKRCGILNTEEHQRNMQNKK